MKSFYSLVTVIYFLALWAPSSFAQQAPDYNPNSEQVVGSNINFNCQHNAPNLVGVVSFIPAEKKYVVRVAPFVQNGPQTVNFIGQLEPSGFYSYNIQMPTDLDPEKEYLIDMEVFDQNIDLMLPNTVGNPKGKGTMVLSRPLTGSSQDGNARGNVDNSNGGKDAVVKPVDDTKVDKEDKSINKSQPMGGTATKTKRCGFFKRLFGRCKK